MGDTFQGVSWALERKCVLRSGDQWFMPCQTQKQLHMLRAMARAEREGNFVDGIWVRGWKIRRDHSGNSHDIPCDGVRIDEQIGSVGGFRAALAICHACEANVETDSGADAAGCYGFLNIRPDSKELDRWLWEIIHEHNWESQLRAAFPVTTPLWYGFWINSPLLHVQSEFLLELLNAVCDREELQNKEVSHFLKALQAAVLWQLPMHVNLWPLGCIMLDWHKVFPHCPRCKANARLERWKATYPTEPHECRVCGHSFIPNDHHSDRPDDFDWCPRHDLGDLFNLAEYEQFIRTFLLHRGCPPEVVPELIDNWKKELPR